MKQKLSKITNTLLDILIVLIMVLSLCIIAASAASKKSGVANVFGLALLSIQTDSMEPVICPGDLILAKTSQAGSEAVYETGDVVAFFSEVQGTRIILNHRIDAVENENGVRYYYTRGDNTPARDEKRLAAGDILAVWTGTRIGGLGKVLSYLQTQKGFFFCVLLPMLLFFLIILFRFIRNLIEYNQEKAQQAARAAACELTEEQKRRAIEEYLAAQQASGSA